MRKLLLFLILALWACQKAPQDDPGALTLRTYDVPRGTARQVVASLKDVLWMGDQKIVGRAVVTPDGRLAVLAPPNIQSGIQPLIDEVRKRPAKYEQGIELHYFVVVGKPATSPQPPPPGAGEIQNALDEIVRSQGPQSFTLAQSARLSTLSGDQGDLTADKLKVWQQGAETEDGVDAKVGFEFADNEKKNRIETRVTLVPDRVVVLGATGERVAPDAGALYYVVRLAPRAGGSKP
jgi:hypothetical protein